MPFVLGGMEARVSASIGLAFTASCGGAESLLANADIAMYHAKAAGKNRYAIFEPQMQDVLHERLRLEADIGRALIEQEFFLEYQPSSIWGHGACWAWRPWSVGGIPGPGC